MCCVGTNGKRKENTGVEQKRIEQAKKTYIVAWEPMENMRKTYVLRRTYRKHKENTGVAQEPIENKNKTCVFNGNLQNTRKTCVLRGNLWKHMATHVLRKN